MRVAKTNMAASLLNYTESFHTNQYDLKNDICSNKYRSSPTLKEAVPSSSEQFTAPYGERSGFLSIKVHQLHHFNLFIDWL